MITVVRGVLVGKTVYWIARNYCGMKSSVIEADILDQARMFNDRSRYLNDIVFSSFLNMKRTASPQSDLPLSLVQKTTG